eukprot:6390066-Prorocentrum_lima.AAC.1
MDDKSSPQSSSPNSMSLGMVLGLYFSPVSKLIASSFAVCRILCPVGHAAFNSSSGIQHGP